jgi:formyl-CoA transferase/CoA:oxalate CoA-transferase
VVHRGELVPALEKIFAERPATEWIEVLSAAEIPCGRIRSVPEALDSPEARARDMVVDVETADGRSLRVVGPPIKLSATPAAVRRPPPRLGEHTDQVLAEIGHSPEEIERLRASRVV